MMDRKHIKAALEDDRRLPWYINKEIRESDMMSLRLFMVRNRKTNQPVLVTDPEALDFGKPASFAFKQAAKALRDSLEGGASAWKVSKGVDHRAYVAEEVAKARKKVPAKSAAAKAKAREARRDAFAARGKAH